MSPSHETRDRASDWNAAAAADVIRTRDERIVDWAVDQAGGDRDFTVSQAREVWEFGLAMLLLRRGFHVEQVASMLGGYLPGDDLPWPERSR